MRKHGGTPSRRDKHVTLAAISPPGVARGRFVGGQQSGLAGSKPPPLFTREASSCSSQGRRQGEPWGASPQPRAPTYLPTCARGVNPCQATQGFALRSIREWAKSLSLLACNRVQEQCIIGHTKKRIIRRVYLGSSVLNPVHWPLLYRWEGQGKLVQSLEPC